MSKTTIEVVSGKKIMVRLDEGYLFGSWFFRYVERCLEKNIMKGYFKSKSSWAPVWIFEVVKQKKVVKEEKKGWLHYFTKAFK